MTRDPVGVFTRHSRRLGDTFIYPFGGAKKAIVSYKPELIRHVLKDNYKNYHKSSIQMKRMGHFLGPGLLTSHGDYWLTQRQLIQRGFRPDALRPLAATMHDGLTEALAHFDRAIANGPVDICAQIRALTFHMVTRSLLTTRLPDEDVARIDLAISEIQDFMVRQIVHPYLMPWFVLSGEQRKHDAMRQDCEQVLLTHIKRRRNDPENRQDILQALLDARYDDGRSGMTDQQVLDESLQLLIAAHETSSTALSWALYLLCRHPDVLAAAVEEFRDVLGTGLIAFDDIPSLALNTRVLDEALRLYPPFWMVDRVALADDRVGDVEIPAGMMVVIFIHGAHHAPERWNDAERFQPDRFNAERRPRQPSYFYLPFGAGPRGCIGGNYAQLQMLMIMSELLRNYSFHLANDAPIGTRPRIILRPDGGIPMTISKSA